MRSPSGISGQLLASAARALTVIDSGEATLDEVLDRSDRQYRRALSHLLLGFFKHRRFIDGEIAARVSRRPPERTLALLRAALTQIYFQSAIAPASAVNIAVDAAGRGQGGFVNAVLRRAAAEKKVPPETAEKVFPELIIERWKRRYNPDTLEAFASALLAETGFTVRCEHGMIPPAEWGASGVAAAGNYCFCAVSEAETILASEAFRDGKCYIQDPAAALAPSLLPEADAASARLAIDLCAAPGGKSLMLLEKLDPAARMVLLDRSEARQNLTRENFARRGLLDRVGIAVGDAAELTGREKYSVVLLDAPCTNTGVFRRRPDALWRFSPSSLRETAALQARLLEAAARSTAPGGVLIYGTCSLEKKENFFQIARFVSRHPEFRVECASELLPSLEHDGAFAARLRKSS